jgi:hypothetical protein
VCGLRQLPIGGRAGFRYGLRLKMSRFAAGAVKLPALNLNA